MTGRWMPVLGVLLAAAMPAQGARAEGCKIGRMLELPLVMQGMTPVVSTQINGRTAPFMLDSGAFHSTMSAPVAKELGLSQTTIPGFYMTGVGGSASAGVTVVKRFTLGGVTVPNVEFVVGGSDVGQTGILGQNILGLGDVEYDLPDGAVRLFKPHDCGSKIAMAYWTEGKPFFTVDIESLNEAGRHTVGIVDLDGAKIHAMFDTGAGRTVISLRAAARAGVHPGDPGVERAGWDWGLGGHVVQGWTARFKLLRIGNEELHNVRLRMADIGEAEMLLGADFFVSHRLYVSNAQRRIFFTYTGGRLFDTGAHVDTASTAVAVSGGATGEPTDAEGFSRRGAMRQTQRDLSHAIEDYTRAVKLAPTEPRYVLQRAYAYLSDRKPALAGEDIDTAIRLEPGNLSAHLLRAQMRLRTGDHAGSLADLDVVAAALPRQNTERLTLGQLYSANEAWDRAVDNYGAWLDTHGNDAGRATALNGRCWARALAGKDLARARSDCDAAVRAVPGNASYLDSRGLVNLRLGDDDRAIADYNASLALAPRMAWSLYGRGLAERHKGQDAPAKADIAAAVAVSPDIAERAARFGVR